MIKFDKSIPFSSGLRRYGVVIGKRYFHIMHHPIEFYQPKVGFSRIQGHSELIFKLGKRYWYVLTTKN